MKSVFGIVALLLMLGVALYLASLQFRAFGEQAQHDTNSVFNPNENTIEMIDTAEETTRLIEGRVEQ